MQGSEGLDGSSMEDSKDLEVNFSVIPVARIMQERFDSWTPWRI